MVATRDILWLAGLLEGEGSFISGKSRDARTRSPQLSMATTDKDVAERVAALFNTKASGFQPPRQGSKYAWHVRKRGPRALGWMLTLYPLLGERRQSQVRSVMERCPAPLRFKTA